MKRFISKYSTVLKRGSLLAMITISFLLYFAGLSDSKVLTCLLLFLMGLSMLVAMIVE